MLRLFVGLALPESLSAPLARLQAGVPGARWVEPENFHLTLVFIGEVDEPTAEDIDDGLRHIRAPAVSLEVDHLGSFGNQRRIRSLWAGLAASEPLVRLQGKVAQVVNRAGVELEHRKFKPHITLARFRAVAPDQVGHFIEQHNDLRLPPVIIDQFTLFRSHLGKQAAVYERLADYVLEP